MKRKVLFLCLVCGAWPVQTFALNYGFLFRGAARYMVEEDLRLLDEATRKALDQEPEGATVPWENLETKASGRVEVLRAGTIQGQTCKRLKFFQQAGKGSGEVTYTFCRDQEENWIVRPRQRATSDSAGTDPSQD